MSKLLDSTKQTKHGLKERQKWILGYDGYGSYSGLFSRPRQLKPRVYKATKRQKYNGIPTLQIEGTWPRISFKSTDLIPLDTIRTEYPQRLDTLYQYATLDAKAALELYHYFRHCMGEAGLLMLHDRVWNPSLQCLADMARNGVAMDTLVLEQGRIASLGDAIRLQQELDKWQPGFENWNSGPQLKRLLYTQLKYKTPPVSGTSKAVRINFEDKQAVDEAALHWHLQRSVGNDASSKAGIEALLAYRKAVKLSQFFDLLLASIVDGRIHCQLAPDTDTGRLSCRNPNLQQIPAKDPYHIRRAFVPSPGCSLLVVDYAQLELYVLAHFLLEKFNDDKLASDLRTADVHSATAKRCWPAQLASVPLDAIKEHPDPSIRRLRDSAKTVNFAVNYGKSASGLGYQIEDSNGTPIGTEAAEALLNTYFRSYPGVQKYQTWAKSYAAKHGEIRTLLGRTRPLPYAGMDLPAKPAWGNKKGQESWREMQFLRSSDLRRALNTPIQGSAADIVTCALLKISRSKELTALGCRALLQIHDELIFEVPTENAERALVLVIECLEKPLLKKQLLLPLKVSAKVCRNWEDGK